MKPIKLTSLLLSVALLLSAACGAQAVDASAKDPKAVDIVLSDAKVTVDGAPASTDPSAPVYTGAEIVYYHDGTDAAYGEGKAADMHSAAEAQAHTVVTVTQPGTYRLTGSLSKGQISIDLGKSAKTDPKAVVTLILDNVDVTCTVAPALIFYNVYECDQAFLAYDDGENPDYQPSAVVDTTAAGANVIIAAGSVNNFTGSHVARIYKEGTTKKLHKYDAAFYSKKSMNINGDNGDNSGVLNIVADNEGLDAELHLTINGGTIHITSQDDGINTNEDFVSVTTVNGGKLTIDAGRGSEGDGIDSNGYLVINGGEIWTTAHPGADGGIDADSPILLNGGTLYAFGGRNDAADKASAQPYMELSFASRLAKGTLIELKDEKDTVIWSATLTREAQSVTLATPELKLNTTYHLYVDGVLQCWNGNSFGMMRPGGMGGFGGGEAPGNFDRGQRPEQGGERPDAVSGATQGANGQTPPEPPADGRQPMDPTGGRGGFDRDRTGRDFKGGRDFDPSQLPPDFDPAQMGGRGFPGFGGEQASGAGSTDFVLTETTRSFSGVCDSDASGKTRVSFTVEGASRSGRSTVLEAVKAITPSVELDPSLVQITVTDDPSESYAASCLLSDGLEAINSLVPKADGDYLLTVAVVSGSGSYTGATQLSFTVGALPFGDVSSREEGYEAIKALYKAGAMTGTGEGAFSPNMTVTRAQAITVLARLAGAKEAEINSFSDVTSGCWYAGYVGWAVDNGIVQGDGQGHFFPDATVTAEQMALMLGRYKKDYVNSKAFRGDLTRSQMAQMLSDIM